MSPSYGWLVTDRWQCGGSAIPVRWAANFFCPDRSIFQPSFPAIRSLRARLLSSHHTVTRLPNLISTMSWEIVIRRNPQPPPRASGNQTFSRWPAQMWCRLKLSIQQNTMLVYARVRYVYQYNATHHRHQVVSGYQLVLCIVLWQGGIEPCANVINATEWMYVKHRRLSVTTGPYRPNQGNYSHQRSKIWSRLQTPVPWAHYVSGIC